MSNKFDVDFQNLEDTIEISRLDQDWNTLKLTLQDYSRVFDLTTEISTRYHNNLKELKSYYWVCLAEYTFHVTGDFTASIDCLRRAGAFYYSNLEIRILIVRFLLLACRPTITQYQSIYSTLSVNAKSLMNFDLENLQLSLYLGDYAVQLSKASVQKIQTYLDAVSIQEKSALINVLATFSNLDVFNVCREFSSYSPDYSVSDMIWDPRSDELCFLRLVMTICLYLLRPIQQLSILFPKFTSQSLSIYQYWLYLDATTTRATIHELMYDGKNAQLDLSQLLQHISMTHFTEIPGICGSLVILAAAKLPIIEGRFNLFPTSNNVLPSFQTFVDQISSTHESNVVWKSFNDCLLDKAIWTSYLPLPLRILLVIELTFCQLRILLKQQHYGSEDYNEVILVQKFKEIFQNIQQFYFYLQEKENESQLYSSPIKSLENFKYLSNSLVPSLPSFYESNIHLKASLPRVSFLLFILSSILYSVNHHYHSYLTIYPENESNLQNSEYNYHYLEEIYGIISWAYSLEIVPSITTLWNVAQIYYLIDDHHQLRLKTYRFLLQCSETMSNELKRRQLFHQKRQSVLGRPKTDADIVELPIQWFLKYSEDYELELNSYVFGLKFTPSLLRNPYLCVSSIAELMIQYHNYDGSIHGFYLIEKSSAPRDEVATKSSSSISLNEITDASGSELHEVIEIVIATIKDYFGLIGFRFLEYAFHTYILSHFPSSSNDRKEFVTSKGALDALLSSTTSLQLFLDDSLFRADSILTPFPNNRDSSFYEEHKSGNSYLHEFPDIPTFLRPVVQSLKEECIVTVNVHLPGFIILFIQLGKLFYQYSLINNRLSVSYAHQRIYLQISLNIFILLTELMEMILDNAKLLETYFPRSNTRQTATLYWNEESIDLLENFYVLQIEILLYHSLLLAELQAPVNASVQLVKEILQSKILQQELSKIMITDSLKGGKSLPQGSHQLSVSFWQIYEKRFLHLLVLLITNAQYHLKTTSADNELSFSSSSDKPEIFALSMSFLQRILQVPAEVADSTNGKTPSSHRRGGLRSVTRNNDLDYDLNVHYTMMLLYYYSGERKLTLQKCEELMKELFYRMNLFISRSSSETSGGPSKDSTDSIQKRKNSNRSFLLPIITQFAYYENGRSCSNSCDRYILVKYLLGVCSICFRLSKYSYLKIGLLESWKFLYSIPIEIQERLDFLIEHLATISEEEIIDIMRYIPIPAGEQLSLGGGFSVKRYHELEGEIFYYVGLLLQHDPSMLPATMRKSSPAQQLISSDVFQYYQIALQIYPTHIKSLLAMANLYYERYLREMKLLKKQRQGTSSKTSDDADETIAGEDIYLKLSDNEDGDENDESEKDFLFLNQKKEQKQSPKSGGDAVFEESFTSSNLAAAYYYLQQAYNVHPNHPDVWKMSSLLHKAMGLEEASLEALIFSMEKEEMLPIRSYNCITEN